MSEMLPAVPIRIEPTKKFPARTATGMVMVALEAEPFDNSEAVCRSDHSGMVEGAMLKFAIGPDSNIVLAGYLVGQTFNWVARRVAVLAPAIAASHVCVEERRMQTPFAGTAGLPWVVGREGATASTVLSLPSL